MECRFLVWRLRQRWGFGFTADGYVNVSHYLSSDKHNTSDLAITAGEWNHVSFMRSGGKIWLSCNGQVYEATTDSTANAEVGSGYEMFIGTDASTDEFFSGQITNVRITNSVARYLTTYNATSIKKTYPQPTVTVTGDDAHFDKVEVLLQGGGADVSKNAYSLDPVDGSSQLPTNSGGKFSDGYYFQDRSNDSFYVNGSNTGWLDFTNEDFTIEFWHKRAGTGDYDYLFAHGRDNGWEHVAVRIQNNNALRMYFKTYQSGQSGAFDDSFVDVGYTWTDTSNWHHVAMERHGGTVTTYVDGSAQSTTINVGSKYFYTGHDHANQGRLGIGSDSTWNDGCLLYTSDAADE